MFVFLLAVWFVGLIAFFATFSLDVIFLTLAFTVAGACIVSAIVPESPPDRWTLPRYVPYWVWPGKFARNLLILLVLSALVLAYITIPAIVVAYFLDYFVFQFW
ncbi:MULTISPECIES: hypothetical protein [Henriciella]|uniref:hypothetical protein n=1 Tax=Henriciella TaxID=453849 RepID=UPI0035152B8D